MEQRHYRRLVLFFLGIITAFVSALAFVAAKSVILPFVFAVFAAYTVEPLIRVMGRLRIARWAGAVLIVIMLGATLHFLVEVVVSTLEILDARLPEYSESLQKIVDRLPLPAGMESLDVSDPDLWRSLALSVFGDVSSIATAVTGLVTNMGLILVLMTAVIIGRQSFDQRIDEVTGQAMGTDARKAASVIDAIDAGIQRYMLVKTLVSLGMGIAVMVVHLMFSSEFAVIWGLLTFVLNFIPTFGPVIAAVPACCMLFLQYPDATGMAIVGSLATATVLFIFVNVVEPRLFGEHLNLNFFAVVLALLFWGFLWGIPGAIIAVPVTMMISLISKEVGALRPLHDLLRS